MKGDLKNENTKNYKNTRILKEAQMVNLFLSIKYDKI
jgi:hypothetical protein